MAGEVANPPACHIVLSVNGLPLVDEDVGGCLMPTVVQPHVSDAMVVSWKKGLAAAVSIHAAALSGSEDI